jgi:hypothetical protein
MVCVLIEDKTSAANKSKYFISIKQNISTPANLDTRKHTCIISNQFKPLQSNSWIKHEGKTWKLCEICAWFPNCQQPTNSSENPWSLRNDKHTQNNRCPKGKNFHSYGILHSVTECLLSNVSACMLTSRCVATNTKWHRTIFQNKDPKCIASEA